jgi:hypothetical protein
MNLTWLLIAIAILLANHFLGHSPEPELENPPVEGPEKWYEEWSHRSGSACTWPPKTQYEELEEWAHRPGAYCTWPPKYEDGRTPGHSAPYKEEQ